MSSRSEGIAMRGITYLGGAAVALGAIVAGPAQSQSTAANASGAAAPAGPDAGSVGEIVVTAQKRSESVQKIPLAVSAIGGAALQQRGDTGLAGLGQVVPGLNVSEQVGQARLTLRGIGVDNISTGAES